MPGGGTTNAGAFRFPYQFLDIAQEVRDKLEAVGMDADWERIIDNFVALYMDRDRALEDYTTAAARVMFTTVAGDGSGDYTTIKAACEAQTVATTNGGWNIIYVKPQEGGYQESGLGAVTWPSVSLRVQIWAGGTINDADLLSMDNNTTLWITGQWIKTNILHLALKGFTLQTAAVTTPVVSASSSGTNGSLSLESCRIIAPLYHTTVSKSFSVYKLTNCTGTLHGGTWTESLLWDVRDSSLSLASLAGGDFSFTNSAGSSTYSQLRFINCGLGVASFGACNWTGSYDSTGNGRSSSWVEIRDCVISANSTTNATVTRCHLIFTGNSNSNSENSGNYQNRWVFTNCGRGSNSNQIPTAHYGTMIISDNNITGQEITINQDAPGVGQPDGAFYLTGTYGKVTLNCYQHMAILALNQEYNSLPLLDVQGNKNMIFCTMNRSNQGADGTPVQITGDNNVINFIAEGFSGSYTNLGSGNIINAATGSPLTAEIMNARGDLIAAFGNDDARRLAVGSDGQMLQADSTQVLGLKWVDPAHFEYDAKGDVLVATGDNTYDRYGVGADQRTLRADSASYVGVSWDYQRTLKNKLTANQASLETDTAGWAAESGCSIARNAANASHGTASLEIVKL